MHLKHLMTDLPLSFNRPAALDWPAPVQSRLNKMKKKVLKATFIKIYKPRLALDVLYKCLNIAYGPKFHE